MNQLNIFVIDDCDMMREFLGRYLSGLGNVHAFESGYEALAEMRLENFPHVIVLDLNLPDVNGIEIIQQLKEKGLLNRSKVLVLSGDDSANSRISCLTAGASDYLVKPFHPRELKLRVENVLRASQIGSAV